MAHTIVHRPGDYRQPNITGVLYLRHVGINILKEQNGREK